MNGGLLGIPPGMDALLQDLIQSQGPPTHGAIPFFSRSTNRLEWLPIGTTAQVLTEASGLPSYATPAGGSLSVAIIADTKSLGTDGGTLTSGAWRTRDLNTEITDINAIVSIASNQFTLGAGTYIIEWSTPGFACLNHQSMLYNITNSVVVQRGTSEYSDLPFGSVAASTISRGACRVEPSGSTVYEIRHRGNTTRSTDGFGRAGSLGSGETEVYTIVTIWKLA